MVSGRKCSSGKGRFSSVTYIQRVDTQGGTAPATACDKARQGQEVRVNYKAAYVFYCAKEGGCYTPISPLRRSLPNEAPVGQAGR
jgi:hypothetical protein